MNFVSHRQLIDDVRDWSNLLPNDLIAVAGVPRSGLLPALHLALHRNIHLVTLEDLAAGERPWQKPLRRFVSAKTTGRVLIVDDSLNSGRTLHTIRARFHDAGDFLLGAVYGCESRPDAADYIYRNVSMPRCFEWMLFHSSQIESACLDLDGVLCCDPSFLEEDQGPGLEQWRAHLSEAKPKFLPGRKVTAVVTSRLEKYRPETEAWLRKHHVLYGELVMSPHPTAADRRAAGDHAQQKARYYRQRSDARLFIESSLSQSREIARLSLKPVLCTDSMEMIDEV
ncbi:MAG: hypothetical protein IID46_10930, partial [Planctomycetes bacterium]|nr:hypothetical protein [Planctomycetota bacterium]